MNTFVQNPKYPELICVRTVELRHGFVVHVTFTDGTERDIDLDPLIGLGPVFAPIRNDPELFRRVYVDPETETLTWPNGADIAPETLYYDGNPPWLVDEAQTPKRRSAYRRALSVRTKTR
jgi:Protein of unknown function (DUF2442)